MKVVKEANIPGETVEVVGGSVEFRRIIFERSLIANMVYISPNVAVYGSDHIHDEREMLFVISGDGTIFDGDNATPITTGDTVIFEPNEPHWYAFGKDGAKIIELKWK